MTAHSGPSTPPDAPDLPSIAAVSETENFPTEAELDPRTPLNWQKKYVDALGRAEAAEIACERYRAGISQITEEYEAEIARLQKALREAWDDDGVADSREGQYTAWEIIGG